MTVADILTRALQRINSLQAGEVPSPEDLQDAFQRLNSLMGKWRLRRLLIPYVLRTTWTISSTKGTLASPYTVGTGGDVNLARPSQPNNLIWKYQDTSVSPTIEYRLLAYTDAMWQATPQKNLTATVPSAAYYNPTYASALGSLYLWPVPSQSNLQGVLYSPASIANFSATSDAIVLPDGYDAFLEDQLCVDLWPTFREGDPVDQGLVAAATDSMDAIKVANFRMDDLIADPFGTVGHYDINSDRRL